MEEEEKEDVAIKEDNAIDLNDDKVGALDGSEPLLSGGSSHIS